MAIVRGLQKKDIQVTSGLLRDTRTLGQRVHDFFASATNSAMVLIVLAVMTIFFPGLVDFSLLVGVGVFWFAHTRKRTLPFRMPQTSHVKDYNDLLPNNKPRVARGITFFGNEMDSNEELWFTNDDMRTHVLIFGSTGSGKTEALASIVYNALLQGSGFIYVDGKGDNSLFAKMFSMARAMGREDDLLLVNFMTGARDVIGPQETRLSNTMNPFSQGSSSMLAQLVVSLMDSGSASSDSDMWKGRAIGFVESLMKVLVAARDQGYLLLDANTIRNYFSLDRVEQIAIDSSLPRDNAEPVDLSFLPTVILDPIRNYIITLPGYDRAKKGKQSSQVLEQHGFITMQLTRVFTSLADTYGHIIRTNLAEVDFKDVVLNRRILVVLLPALEKSPDELSNLGKVIIASIKAMMAAGLGDSVEGTYQDLIKRKPTNSKSPFMCVLDEYGYYAVKGFAVVPAQARSLGFSAIFAGQDLPAFEKGGKEEAASIGANTNIKICMKLEDPQATFEFFVKTAGEAYVTKVDSFQTNPSSVFNNYLDNRSASAEKRSRIDLLDLKDQREGEMHIFFKSTLVRAKVFYANPTPVHRMRLNQMLRVEPPVHSTLKAFEAQYDLFSKMMDVGQPLATVDLVASEIPVLARQLEVNKALVGIEKSVASLLAYHAAKSAGPEGVAAAEMVKEAETDLISDRLNVFVRIDVLPLAKQIVVPDRWAAFEQRLLPKALVNARVEEFEQKAGNTSLQARKIATEIIKDMQLVTDYPPTVKEPLSAEDAAAAALEISLFLKTLKEKET